MGLKNTKPPKILHALCKKMLPSEVRAGALQDFENAFQEISLQKGRLKACYWLWIQVFQMVPSFFVNKTLWNLAMFKNYLKISIRNLKRNKTYSLLNIGGLAIGFSCFILIMLYIQHELSYDKFHENSDRIFRISTKSSRGSVLGSYGATPAPLAPALMDEFPEVEYAVRLYGSSNLLMRAGNKSFVENDFLRADKDVFKTFSFELTAGDKNTALENPNTVVISERIAEKYFGKENPIGKIINVNDRDDYGVTGIMKNIPKNSIFHCDFIASLSTFPGRYLNNWGNFIFHTFILLREGKDIHGLEAKYPAFLDAKYKGEEFWKKNPSIFDHQKLTDIHLEAGSQFSMGDIGDIKYIHMYSIIAFFILLIACVNYMNLSTAKAAKRAREVGIRKVAGAQRIQLIRQFLSETVFVTLISLIFSIGLVYLFLPVFNNLIDREIAFYFGDNYMFLIFLTASGIIVGLLSGIYPAFFISRFRPFIVLKGSFSRSRKGIRLRNFLVVFQFSISILLIVGALVVSKQLGFIKNTELGYTKDNIIGINIKDKAVREKCEIYKEELLKLTNISKVSLSSSLPLNIDLLIKMKYEGIVDEEKDRLLTYFQSVDFDYLETYKMEIIQGRKFSKEIDGGSKAYILNETAVKRLGWENPIGKMYGNDNEKGFVVGVVRDFHNRSMHLPMEPVTIAINTMDKWKMSIKLGNGDFQTTIKEIGNIWNKFSSGYPFEWEFMNEKYNSIYKSEIRLGIVFSYFAGLAIIICCLGLFGLAAFTVEQSTKEIGIRKVLGASGQNISFMLFWKFTKWVIIANIIAIPAAWFVMNRWLEDFEYRATIGIDTYVFAAIITMIITMATVGYQTLKAAHANPVNSLKYE